MSIAKNPSAKAPTTSLEVRTRLVDALKLDLIGPWAGHPLADERLPGWTRPSTWYLSGFLIPSGTPPEHSADPDEDDDLGEVPESSGLSEESAEDQRAAKKGFFPSSMGLSFLVSNTTRTLKIVARWGDYTRGSLERAGRKAIPVWQRMAREETVELILDRQPLTIPVPRSDGLELHAVEREILADDLSEHILPGTRSVSVFLVNRRRPLDADRDRAFAFQAELEVRADEPFVARPDPRGGIAQDPDPDEDVADLHYADTPAYATGHGVSAEWQLESDDCYLLRSAWLPSAEVEKTDTVKVPGVKLSMDALGSLADGAAAKTALSPLVTEYRSWIGRRTDELDRLDEPRRGTAADLLRQADIAADRIERGIAALAADEDALDAFRVANRAVARALEKRLDIDQPEWRAFQLAFLLLNLPGLIDPHDRQRQTVDLLFFPTGGGKTEAYFGLAAFTMVLRRLRHPQDDGRVGAGVSVIMRYTLRLLTLDQLGRAAGLICALELDR